MPDKPELLLETTRNTPFQFCSSQLGSFDELALRDWLVRQLEAGQPRLTITFYLNERLRRLEMRELMIDEEISIEGLTGDPNLLDQSAHWANAVRLARLLASCAHHGWSLTSHSADNMKFFFECDDDGPCQTYYTFALTIITDPIEDARIMLLGEPDE